MGNSSLLLLQIMGNNTAFLSQIRGKRGYHWDDGHNLRSQNDGLGGNSDRWKRVRTSLHSSS